ncbi:4Fe-4S ferredoxin-type domain-containing protein [Favolaschia claudopus]|uniref:4Fe-4S ferredoxin-type domain-containing protein n=1 Tax=Favolaschia claudopus TaxID=2862362 RepID=A0AAW0D7L3_9AGAR
MLGSALNFPAHDLLDDRPQKRPRNDEPVNNSQDKDNLKGTKRLSCRECRRYCDRVFPCQSCCKRGCAEICPEGLNIMEHCGRGSRFILANTEQLHEKVSQLSERVRGLEDALQGFSAQHPLLAPDLLRIKTSQELYVPPSAALNTDPTTSAPVVAPDILQLSPKALCEEARRNALWQYNLDPSRTFIDLLIHSVYTTPIQELSPRRLALLLMVLSVGSLVDLSRPLGSLNGEAYHHLARAAVCEIPLMEEPDFDELHALFFMIWYHLVFSDNRKAVGYAWNLMGFVAKLAQGVSCYRDGSRIKVIPEEYERRRAIFWELLNMDCRMSLSLGRPPSLSLSHVDTKPPAYTESTHVPKDEILYHEWKTSFFIKCLSPILEAVAAVTPPEYKHLLELDTRTREFPQPAMLTDSGATARFLVMQRAIVASGRDIAILQLHRRCFTEALSGSFSDLHHPYAPSVLATYIGASSLIETLETLFDREPQLSARFLHFWFNAFSATVTLALFVSRAPATSLAPYAMQDLERICRLFRRVATLLPFSAKSLPIMEKLADKARRACSQWHSDVPLPSPSSTSNSQLPPAFLYAHPTLARYAEEMTFAPPLVPLTGGSAPAVVSGDTEPWLPDVYRFASHGVGVDERYRVQRGGENVNGDREEGFASAQPTPFIPGEPRVAANDAFFHFEHGALTAELAETSYMAWF